MPHFKIENWNLLGHASIPTKIHNNLFFNGFKFELIIFFLFLLQIIIESEKKMFAYDNFS